MRSVFDFRVVSICVLAGLLGGAASNTFAHRIDISAAVDHDGIHVEVKDSHAAPIADVAIEVTDPEGAVLAHGVTDAAGKFSFTLATTPDHVNIVAKTADGHKTSLTLGRDHLTRAENAAIETESRHEEDEDHRHPDEPVAGNSEVPPTHSHDFPSGGIESEMDEIEELHGLLAKQQAALDDVQAQLLRINQSKPGVSRESVIAGLGFIFGLTGLITAVYALRRATGKGA